MNVDYNNERRVFSISVEDVQEVAVDLLERRLTDDEMRTAEKCIDRAIFRHRNSF